MKRRVFSFLMAVLLLIGSLPVNAFAVDMSGTKAGATAVYTEKVADASTQDVWSELMNTYRSTQYVGRIWTDKTVSADNIVLTNKLNTDEGTTIAQNTTLTMNENADFQIALSAMSSSLSTQEEHATPVDVMFILDISSSMYRIDSNNDGKIDAWDMTALRCLVTSVNDTIKNVQNLNDFNRVGVVLYYGGNGYKLNAQSKVDESGKILLPLGRYTGATDDKYVALDETNYIISSASGLKKDGVSHKVVSHTLQVVAGTYMQLGILNAMSQFKGVGVTTSHADDKTEHIPVFVLMSDGEPTASTNNFFERENAKFGNNTVKFRNPAESDFVTQLTAAYAKAEVDIHYKKTTPLFYTLSLGNSVSLDVMDPGKTVTINGVNRNEAAIKKYWEDLIKNKSVSYNTYPHELDSTYNKAKRYTTTTTKLSNPNKDTFPSNIQQMQYVNRAFTAATANDLPAAFNEVFNEIRTQMGTSPTYMGEGMDSSQTGYVTMLDELGDYMEIKSMDAITLEGVVYTYNGTTSSTQYDGYTDTTYTFTQSVTPNTTLDARQGNKKTQSLGKILITERDYADPAARDSLLVQIPVSLLPLRYYEVAANGNLTIRETLPIRIVYSVGLLDDVRTALSSGNYSTVNGLTTYIANHTNTKGEIQFYSNYWDGVDSNNDGYTDGNSYSTFVPATTNPFYYYTEDTVFYKADGTGGYTPVTATTQNITSYKSDLSGTVYYKQTYYTKDGKTSNYVGLDINAAINRIGSISWDNIANYIGINGSNQYYMKKGNAKLSLANAANFIEVKDVGNTKRNVTNTASTVLNPTWNANAIGGNYDTYLTENYMGNNGRISFKGLGSLIVVKNVTSEANQTPDPNTEFTFTITLGEIAAQSVACPAIHTGASGKTETTVTFNNNAATVTLKANESIIINGLPAGTTYTVEETGAELRGQDVSGAYEENYLDGDASYPANGTTTDGCGTIVTNETDTVSVNNTYKYTNTPVNAKFQLAGEKSLDIKNVSSDSNASFDAEFYLQYWHESMGIGGGWVNVSDAIGTVTYGIASDSNADPVAIDYAEINEKLETWEFNTPGQYFFRIIEKNSGLTLHGVYHDDTIHSFIVTVVDNGDGTLSVNNVASAHRDTAGGLTTQNWSQTSYSGIATWSNSSIDFTNEYGTTMLTVNIDKDIKDTTGSGYDKLSGYQFEWKYLGSYKDKKELDDYKRLVYSGSNAVGTSDKTKADGIAGFSIKYGVSDSHSGSSYVDARGVHFYPSSNTKDTYYEYYEIKEASGNNDGMSYSKAVYYIQVVVEVEGNEIASTSYSVVQYTTETGTVYTYDSYDQTSKNHVWTDKDGNEITRQENNALIFLNTYSDSVIAELGVTKIIEGRDWKNDDSFTFTLTPIQYNGMGLAFDLKEDIAVVQSPMPAAPNTLTATASNASSVATASNAKVAEFDDITFTQVGTYYFTVTENVPDEAIDNGDGTYTWKGMSYSNDTIYAKVEVSADQNGKLDAEVYTYRKGRIDESSGIYDLGSFTNIYTADPVSVTFSGKKTLKGRTLEAGEFAFGLYYGKDLIGSATNDADGNYSFTRTFDKIGTYEYTVKEVPNDVAGVTYDNEEYSVTVVVTDGGEGKLIATVNNVDSAVGYNGLDFTNIYAPSGKLYLNVTKTISGRDWRLGDSFTFGLYENDPASSNETPMLLTIAAPENLETGTTSLSDFFEVTLNEAGTYTYYIKEMTESTSTMKSDDTVYKVDVTATDNGDGTLAITAVYSVSGSSRDEIKFENTYTPGNGGGNPGGSTPSRPDRPDKDDTDSDSGSPNDTPDIIRPVKDPVSEVQKDTDGERNPGFDGGVLDDSDLIPATGDNFNPLGLSLMAIVGIVGFCVAAFLLRANRKKEK